MSAFTYSIKTMGCKANLYDSQLLEKDLMGLGGTRNDQAPDLYVLNSCTVTNEADKQSHYEINQIKKRSPNSLTIVTGCYAQVGQKELEKNRNINLIINNEDKRNFKKTVAKHFQLNLVDDLNPKDNSKIFWGELPQHLGKTRSFVKIQEGCNDFCTYCIIPYARGSNRSVRMGHVLEEIERLSQEGCQEVILTGTNIADYGKDFGKSFEDLVEAIFKHTKINRLRLSSLDPTEITDRLLKLMASEKRLMPHFHISLQSVVSRILKAMKRHYRQEEVIQCLTRIHEMNPDIYVGMDIITGFPSETDEEHQETMKILNDLPWTRLHVFPYSERKDTPAIKIPGAIPLEMRKKRAQNLLKLSHEKHEKFVRRFIGKTIPDVLFETYHEKDGKRYATGHAANYVRVTAVLPEETLKDEVKNHVLQVEALDVLAKPSCDWTLIGSCHA